MRAVGFFTPGVDGACNVITRRGARCVQRVLCRERWLLHSKEASAGLLSRLGRCERIFGEMGISGSMTSFVGDEVGWGDAGTVF